MFAAISGILRRLAADAIPDSWLKLREQLRHRTDETSGQAGLLRQQAQRLQEQAVDQRPKNPGLFVRDLDRILKDLNANPDPKSLLLSKQLVAFRNAFRPADPLVPSALQADVLAQAGVIEGGAPILEALRKLFAGEHAVDMPRRLREKASAIRALADTISRS